MTTPNLTVELKLDPQGRISTDPMDIVKLSQQLLLKAVMGITDNGTKMPTDMAELSLLLRDMNTTALTTRKLDQEKEAETNRRAQVEAFKEFQAMVQNSGIQPIVTERRVSPYEGLNPPVIDISPTELTQGEQPLNSDVYLGA